MMLMSSQVVVDPTINADCMEMYADEDARGGILEPEGIVNIKFRKDRQLETMARLDAPYASLKQKLTDKSLSPDQQSEVKVQMTERENRLLPVYSQISLQFADLHDRAGRMQAKETIRHPLQWKDSRRFFYWRLRRRLNEESILKKMGAVSARGPAARGQKLETLRAWTGVEDFEHDDRAVACWYEENKKTVTAKVTALQSEAIASEVAGLIRGNKDGGFAGVKQFLSMLPVEEREEAMRQLSAP